MEPLRSSPRPNRVARLRPGWEARLYMAAHPVAYPLLRGLSRLGPAVRVPGVGVVVNDAECARAVLMDGETFRKDGPGSPGDLWTPVLGPSVLLNMEGDAHRSLRRRLAELFTPGYAETLVDDVLAGPLREVSARLERGESVDVVAMMRLMAGAVISRVIGLETTSEDDHRSLFEAGERIVAMVSLRTRRLSPAQIARARAVLDPLGDIAAKAYAEGSSTTVMGRMRALGLSEDEARGAAGAFFLTGTETVATLVPRLIALLHDTGTAVALGQESTAPASLAMSGCPDAGAGRAPASASSGAVALDRAIDEAMRVTTPTPVMLRSVHAETRIADVPVRPGDRVLIATHNCCRAYGPFDSSRPMPPELRRLWFGAGPHFCLGYPLAMAEIRAVTRTLLAGGPLTITHRSAARGVLIPTYRRLRVRRAGEGNAR
ncbi:cytochrome P450 [Actinomadura logoneensis]|uniref:Cytochrome P450 n=1 Tax=Actinomadura logoneensis TaxID=2293572 RepID=A0A372JT05_9ACTN|nr:cytochrome P450 [Actinomadura logoneensis]RFU43147.1 cytochrome P450 [Actinomadura logoneensis]